MNNDLTSWHSYPKIYALGHGAVKAIFYGGPVVIEEKIDGSQFSFGKFNGVLKCKSKSKELILDAPEKMFQVAVDVVKSLEPLLVDGWTYRCEYLQKPKHNVLKYGRVPYKNLILFDVNTAQEQYLSPLEKLAVGRRLGLEVVPIKVVEALTLDNFKTLLSAESILGNVKIEGLVFKNYTRFGEDGKAYMAKFVSEEFKEAHEKDWKVTNPNKSEIVQVLIDRYRTDARKLKAIQHLKEQGLLTNSPKDIGILFKEFQRDLEEECEREIKDALFAWAKDKILRGASANIPNFYKMYLAENQFKE